MNCDFQILFSQKPDSIKPFNMMNIPINDVNVQLNLIHQNSLPKANLNYCMTMNNTKTTNTQRVLFKKEEDEKIIKLVKIFGTRHWPIIAQFMEGRTAKQCRDRYSNYLIPGFFQGEWTDEEDKLLLKLHKELGPKWSNIKKSFPNRSANNIKNRWYYFLHKKVQNEEKEKIHFDETVQSINKKSEKTDIKNELTENSKKTDSSMNKIFEIPFFQNDNCEFLFEDEMFISFNNNLEVDY